MQSYPATTFPNSTSTFQSAVDALASDEACRLDHGAIEALAEQHGRAVIRALVQDHLDLRAEREQPEPVRGADGVLRTEVRTTSRMLDTKWGCVTVNRLALVRHGATGGLRPLDAALNLPPGKHSHGVQRELAWGAAQGSYDAVIANLRRTTDATIGKRQAEELVVGMTADFEDFYLDRPRLPDDSRDESLLVLTFDGSGVVMRPEGLRPATRKKAEKERRRRSVAESAAMGTPADTQPHRKRMAEVAAVYSLEVVSRTPDDVLRELRKTGPYRRRPKAAEKRAWASVARPIPDVVDEAFCEAVLRDEGFERRWVAVVDGNEEQLKQIDKQALRYGAVVTVVIDFIHVLGKLWKAAKAVLGSATTTALEEWVDQRAECILRGKSSQVAAGIRRSATMRELGGKARKAMDSCCNYLLKHRARLRYHEFLRDGLPIASGVIEGACRSLVQDRMDITGARWGLPGAEAVLKLRSLRASGDLDDYLDYHFRRQLQRVHLDKFAADELANLREAA